MLSSPDFSLEEYEFSVQTGFLPETPPLRCLPDTYYAPWETVAQDLAASIQNGTIRQAVESLPVLNTTKLRTKPEWRRAYVVLSYLTHAYVWGGEIPKEVGVLSSRHLIWLLTISVTLGSASCYLSAIPGSFKIPRAASCSYICCP